MRVAGPTPVLPVARGHAVTWFLVWTVLVLAACGVLFVLGRRLWRQMRTLTRELGEASDRLAEITERLADLGAELKPLPGEPDGVRSQGPRRRL